MSIEGEPKFDSSETDKTNEGGTENIETESRAQRFREFSRFEFKPVAMEETDKKLIDETFEEGRRHLAKHYCPGFGIFPSGDPDSNYFNQVWARDSAHAGGNYFAWENPEAAIDSLATLLRHQRADGSIPSRVEREYEAVRFTPGLRYLSKPIFNVIEKKIRGRDERPVHEGMDLAGGEDTVPATLIAAGELFINSEKGCAFVTEHFDELKKAADFFKLEKTDSEDGLAVMSHENPDWADTIARKGKLGTVNVWWGRALRVMEYLAREMGDEETADAYRMEFEKVKRAILEKLYVREGGREDLRNDAFFRAEASGNRLDTVASIFGALYFLPPDEAVNVERTLKRRVERSSGLQNFDPPYPQKDLSWLHRRMGRWLYHNKFVWPWVTAQNIQLKIKIAREHADEAIRKEFQREAVGDIVTLAKLFKEAGGAYEIFEPDAPRHGDIPLYKPIPNFMGSMVAYQSVYAQLKALGWI